MLDSAGGRFAAGLASALAGFLLSGLFPEANVEPAVPPLVPPLVPAAVPLPTPQRDKERAPNGSGEGEPDPCSPERRATLSFGVRAARAELLTRYGRPPASMNPPHQADVDALFPHAVATLIVCQPEPCRLLVASPDKLEDLHSLPEDLGYPNGVVTAGSARGLTVYSFAFPAHPLTPLERKFVELAWSHDEVDFYAMLDEIAAEGAGGH